MPGKEIEATVGKVIDEESASLKVLLDEALASSLKLIEDYEVKASEKYKESMLEGRKEAENVKMKVLGSAELMARNAQLTAFEAFFDGIVADALAGVRAVPRDARYERALSKLLTESLQELDPGKYILCCPQQDNTALAAALKDTAKKFPSFSLSVSKKQIESVGGFVISSEDATTEFNSTFEARLERMKPSIRKRVYERFFKEDR